METKNPASRALNLLALTHQHPIRKPDGTFTGHFGYLVEEAKREMGGLKALRRNDPAGATIKQIAYDVLSRLCRDPVNEREAVQPMLGCMGLLFENIEKDRAKKRRPRGR